MCTNQPEERPASCSYHLNPWPKERSIIAVAITHIYIHMYKYTQTQHTHMLAYRGLLVKIHRACSALLPKFSSLGIILSLVMPRGGSDVPYYISTHQNKKKKLTLNCESYSTLTRGRRSSAIGSSLSWQQGIFFKLSCSRLYLFFVKDPRSTIVI